MDDKDKKDLESYILDRSKNIYKDNRTFLWVRHFHFKKAINKEELQIGGGNLLIALGCFATIEYLSNIYFALSTPLKKWPKNNKYKFNATDSFLKLVEDLKLKEALGLKGLDNPKLTEFWSNWRNKLAHFLVQKGGQSLTLIEDEEKDVSKCLFNNFEIRNKDRPPFYKKDGVWKCEADLLNIWIKKISEMITERIEIFKEENIKETLKWIKENVEKQ